MEEPTVTKWHEEIEKEEKSWADWFETARSIAKRYRNERSVSKEVAPKRFQILWSNLEILMPALYARRPNPEISLRNKGNKDPLARLTGYVWESGINYIISDYDFNAVQIQKIKDYLLVGRGVTRNRYDPIFKEDPDLKIEIKTGESTKCEYIYFEDFLHSDARFWEEVTWVGFRHYYSKEELKNIFGEEIGGSISLDASEKNLSSEPKDKRVKKAVIWEIWDKKTKTVNWISTSERTKVLKTEKDPLGLRGFFPCGKPLYATLTNDSLKPVADYLLYQDQALDLDAIVNRLSNLTEYLKVAGGCDGSIPELSTMLKLKDGELKGMKKWNQFKEAGGIEGSIAFIPMEETITAINELANQKERLIGDIYEITGISDIVRGSTNPYEAAKTQQLKGQFANLRMSARQSAVQDSVRDDIAIQSEIFAEHFSPDSIRSMTGYDYLMGANPEDSKEFESIITFLATEPLRDYAITIQTDSTLAFDTQAQREQLNLYLETVTGFVDKATNFCQSAPEMVPYFKETLKFVSSAYNIGRGLEAVLESSFDALTQRLQNPPPPPPDPKLMQVENDFKLESMRIELEISNLELQKEKLANDLAMKKYRVDKTTDINEQKLKIQIVEVENRLEAEKIKLAQAEEQFKVQLLQAEMQHQSQMAPKEEKEPREEKSPVVVNVQKSGGWKMQRDNNGLVSEVVPIE